MTHRLPRRAWAAAAIATVAIGGQVALSPASARVVASKSTDIKRKPVFARQRGTPPAQLVRQDIIVGKGRAARDRDDMRVKYIGRLWGGKLIDDGWRFPAFRFQVGVAAPTVRPGGAP